MALTWRLRKHAEYQRAYARSRKGSTRQISYFFAVREDAEAAGGERGAEGPERGESPGDGSLRAGGVTGPRVGLTVPKAVGKAHERNRIKRRLRAIVRGEIGGLRGEVDVILHPRRSTMEAEFGVLRREVVEIFGRVERALAGVGTTAAGGGRSGGRLGDRSGGRLKEGGSREGQSKGGRSGGNRPEGHRPKGDRPKGDRPKGDRPKGDRPQGDRTEGDRTEIGQLNGQRAQARRG